MKFRRPHIFGIFLDMARVLVLLLLPLVRGLLTSLEGGLQSWLASAWMDILVICFILAFGFLSWWHTGFTLERGALVMRRGILMKRASSVAIGRISWASMVHPWYLRAFRAVQFRADTLGGSAREPDFSMLLRREDALWLFTLLDGVVPLSDDLPPDAPREYRPRVAYLVLLSALTSNSLAGILLASAAISHIGNLMGYQLSERIYGTLEQLTRLAAFGIPPAAAALAYLLLSGWLLAFLSNFTRLQNLYVVRKGRQLYIHSGIFTRRSYTMDLRQINFVDIRQSLMTKILRMESVFLYTAGYGKNKEDISVLIPVSMEWENRSTLHRLLPEMLPSPCTLRPNPGAIMKFLMDALVLCAAVPICSWLLCRLVPSWSPVIRYLGLMAMIPAVWFFTVRLLDFLSSGIARNGDTLTLRYSHLFYLHTVVIPKDRIVKVRLRQSILQWGDQKCDLLIYSRGEAAKRHHLRNLSLSDCAMLLDLPGYILPPRKGNLLWRILPFGRKKSR